MTTIHLKNGALFDAEAPELLEGHEVLVEDDRIVEVSDKPIKTKADHVLDLGGKALLPGLIDCHVHVNSVVVGKAAMERLPSSLVTAKARAFMEAMLMRGFTTVRDAGGADWGMRTAVEEGHFAGPRLFIAGKVISQTGSHFDQRPPVDQPHGCACGYFPTRLAWVCDGVPEVRHAARDEIRKGANQIKIMASGAVASPSDPVDHTQLALDEIAAAVEVAEAANTYVMAHAYTGRAIKRAVECGVRTIEHGNLLDEETAAAMAQRSVYLVPTLVTYEALAEEGAELGLSPVSCAKIEDVRGFGLRAVEYAMRAGVKIGHGSDLLGEMQRHQSREFQIKAEVMSPHQVLVCATKTNAEILNRTGELGVIAPGALADMVVVDGDPLRDLSLLQDQGAHLPLIMQGGRLVKNDIG
ncbi:MAG: amidohydrolase family protein [Alphaproteobacteria bacterium]|jgi:imidazolonepropionase-like amidohydrolase|nr:amidohydrolase family protein [Alphaproteobacteria bacterium]